MCFRKQFKNIALATGGFKNAASVLDFGVFQHLLNEMAGCWKEVGQVQANQASPITRPEKLSNSRHAGLGLPMVSPFGIFEKRNMAETMTWSKARIVRAHSGEISGSFFYVNGNTTGLYAWLYGLEPGARRCENRGKN